MAAELGISVDELLAEDDIEKKLNTPLLECRVEKQSKLSALTKLFVTISCYEIVSLLLILSRIILAKSDYFDAEGILTAGGIIQAVSWILLMVMCFRLYLCQKMQGNDESVRITAIWLAAFFIIGIYQVSLRLVFIGTLNLESGTAAFGSNPLMHLFAVKILKYISLCICVFTTSKILNERKLKLFTIIFITVVTVALTLQIAALYLGKSYSVTADISILYLLFAMFITLWGKADKTSFARIRVE